MKFIKLTKEILDKQHLSILREIGRQIGVKAPAAIKTKEQLVQSILDVQNGVVMPIIPNKRGAKVKLNAIIPSELIDHERTFFEDYGDVEPRPQAVLCDSYMSHTGILDIHKDGYGFLRAKNYHNSKEDAHLSSAVIRKYNLKKGDLVTGLAERRTDSAPDVKEVLEINHSDPLTFRQRVNFEELTPCYPTERLLLESDRKEQNDLSLRLIDLFAPLGRGQRGLIVAPPKTGKTTLLKKIARAIEDNYPATYVIVLLIDERPEEVTDIQRAVLSDVVYSTFDQTAEHHVKVAELVVSHAKRLVERGQDVVILLDSITRLARAYNTVTESSGRTLSGGLDPVALQGPKRFFGSARNVEDGGSLTILATALVDTESRMDEVIFEEFKGTGNMEIVLSSVLAEKRIFPALDLFRSGTRKDELLLSEQELQAVAKLRSVLKNNKDATPSLIEMINKTKTNAEFLAKLDAWLELYRKQV